MWKVVTNSNLNPPLKLFFFLPILTNNNLLLKIYVKILLWHFSIRIFYSLYYFSFLSFHFHPHVSFLFFFFFFLFFSSTHVSSVLSLFPPSFIFFFSLIQEHSSESSSHSLFLSLALSFSLSLSLSFFFFNLISEHSLALSVIRKERKEV